MDLPGLDNRVISANEIDQMRETQRRMVDSNNKTNRISGSKPLERKNDRGSARRHDWNLEVELSKVIKKGVVIGYFNPSHNRRIGEQDRANSDGS